MRIAVMGAGGVGGYFGAALARAGNDKALLTAAQAIAETGAIKEVPPLASWVDKRFLPIVWKR